MDQIEQHYDEHAEAEWLRLETNRTEFAVTQRALDEYLPPPGATISPRTCAWR